MIGYLTGLAIDKDDKTLLVLAGSVGYRVSATTDLLARTEKDQKVQLYIHTAVREDDIVLYGFSKRDELLFFEQLLSVSGVGPRTALDILSAPISLTQNAIVQGDEATLTEIKGIGKKTAQRIILELKNKVVPATLHSPAGKGREEAILALTGLGYERYQVVAALNTFPAELSGTEAIVTHFLKHHAP